MKTILINFFIILFALPVNGVAQEKKGEPFESLQIGKQEWAKKNLDVTHFNNGDPLYEANTFEEWEYAAIKGLPAWCYYNNNPEYGKKYGKLYNYWALVDIRGLIPEGWHIPTEKEWSDLTDYLGGMEIAGGKMKSSNEWNLAFTGENLSGFSGLPGGYRTHEGASIGGGPFYGAGTMGVWWSASRYLVDNVWSFGLSNHNLKLDKKSFVRTAGLYVRFLKD